MRAGWSTTPERPGRFLPFRPPRFFPSALLIVALALLLCWPALAFTDTAGHPYAGAIEDLSSRKIINGFDDGTFGPNKLVTRQQFVKMIAGTMGLTPTEGDKCPFPDVEVSGPSSLYPDNFVALVAKKGITTGYKDGTFKPGDNISRAQVLTMVVRAADNLAPGTLGPTPAGFKATWGSFDGTHAPNAAKAEANGLLAGMPVASLDPWGKMPRGEVAQVLHNLLLKMGGGGPVVEIVDGYSSVPLDLPHLGSVTFGVDKKVPAVSMPIRVDKDTVVKLTDGGGLTYELVVPAGAVGLPISITMRALSNVSSTDVPVKLRGGVLLEPDGLRFAVPAKLTVSGGGVDNTALIFAGNKDGGDVDLAERAVSGGGAAATLWHFSPYVVSVNDPGVAALEPVAKAHAAAVLERAKQVLADPQIRVTAPPSLSLECSDEVTEMLDQQSIDLWLRSADEPESELLRALLTSATECQLVGLDDTAQWQAARKVLLRQQARAEKLLQEYAGVREKMLAVGSYGLIVAKNMALVGGLDAESQSLARKVGEYVATFIDGLLDDIITRHDYKMFRPVLFVGAWANTLGINEGKFDGDLIIRRAWAAMSFTLKTKVTMTNTGQFGDTATWVLESETPIRAHFNEQTGTLLSGEGTGKYVSFTATGAGKGFMPMEGPSFPVLAILNPFNPCRGELTLALEGVAADAEWYGEAKEELPLAAMGFEAIFSDQPLRQWEDGMRPTYSFPLTLRNLEENAVEETVTKRVKAAKGDLEVTLVHTPQKVTQ